MDALYPNLYERFKTEGLCPICLMEMELTPRYTCCNGHTVCQRCRPYYYGCPTCHSPLDIEVQPPQVAPSHLPPPTHFMPHPLPPKYRQQPTAPPVDDFLENERRAWSVPAPSEDQELRACSYSDLGCWIKVPEYLQDLHESRCQFRPHLEEEFLPTDLDRSEDDLVECPYQSVGCNVRTLPWRISIHENYCIYKDRRSTMDEIHEGMSSVTITDANSEYGDPNELVECKYRRYGCMVNMPRRRKIVHEQKCNYSKYHQEEDYVSSSSEAEYDPDEKSDCRWAEYGCRVKPKRSRQEAHEEKCNYRMEECSYGCGTLFQPSRKFAHERSCDYCN